MAILCFGDQFPTYSEIRAGFSETSGGPSLHTIRCGLLKQPDKQKMIREIESKQRPAPLSNLTWGLDIS